jgi:hypothetical protein
LQQRLSRQYKNIDIKAKHFLGSDSKVSVTILAEKAGI